MNKTLVIVESPAKARTINKYLGKEYLVVSSKGHIRDLPRSGGASKGKRPIKKANRDSHPFASLFERMAIDPTRGWKARYEIIPEKINVVSELKKAAKGITNIALATDQDREGEAIAWHIAQTLGEKKYQYKRVLFNEITKSAIKDAFKNPGELDTDKVNAQQTRRFLDRVVGFMVSPLLWKKVARGLSAGRVQSVAVRLIVDRERVIRAFNPEEYWEINALLSDTKNKKVADCVEFETLKFKNKKFRPTNQNDAEKAEKLLQESPYVISRVEKKEKSTRPLPPFITSTLQQAANISFGFSVKRTMNVAQKLYENGHITYMRTDSRNLSKDAVSSVRDFIKEEYGSDYLPEKPQAYASSKGAQEAHEAIRPTNAALIPQKFSAAASDEKKLYELIWRQFVACQMSPMRYLSTVVKVQCGDFELSASGRTIKFPGFYKVKPPRKNDDEKIIPNWEEGTELFCHKLSPVQHFTKPSPRFGEASLVKEMEKMGIGRPSTYASIISTILDRGYVSLEKKRFYAEKIGEIVTDRLLESFPDLMDYKFTAGMENQLDAISVGKFAWKDILDEFYVNFENRLKKAEEKDTGMRPNNPTLTDISCPVCKQGDMMVRTSSSGMFLGCSKYSLPPKERCTKTINLVHGDEIADLDADEENAAKVLRNMKQCPSCEEGVAMNAYLIDRKRKIYLCGNNPDCSSYLLEEGDFRLKGHDGSCVTCEKCGSDMLLESGRFGKYFKCENQSCNNTRKLTKDGKAAPPRMDPVEMPELKCKKVDDYYVLRDGMSGLFLAAKGFPKHRETRAPLLSEILPHQNAVDPKYSHLFSGPVEDPKGNPTEIRFAKKTGEHYLTSTVDGKRSKWQVYFRNGRWLEP